MREIVVISGKGGTGKTSITASLAVLAKNAVIADCDVDAADLHLLIKPEVRRKEDFFSGNEAVIRDRDCTGCGKCLELCRFEAIKKTTDKTGKACFNINPAGCEGCGVCVHFCPAKAIDFPERLCGSWMISDTRCGPMVHARLAAGGENSGKLVAMVRKLSGETAKKSGRDLVITDGPPGLGCPVIASLSGATEVLVVTEPTVSGKHDMERVLGLTKHFKIPSAVIVNKWDINPDAAEEIERAAKAAGARRAGRVRYDRKVSAAQIQGLSVVETDAASGEDIRRIWNSLKTGEARKKP